MADGELEHPVEDQPSAVEVAVAMKRNTNSFK